jgi:hypothetical protein
MDTHVRNIRGCRHPMLQVPSTDMLRSAYQQVSEPERYFVDRLTEQLVRHAHLHDIRLDALLDSPLPAALQPLDTRGYLQRPLVLAALTERLHALQLDKDISLDRVVRELHAIATFSLESIMGFDDLGNPVIDLDNATPEQWAAIKSVEVETNDGLTRATKVKIKIQTHDKLGAIKQLADMLGAYEANNPYRKADKRTSTPILSDTTTAQQAADEYARFIGDNE